MWKKIPGFSRYEANVDGRIRVALDVLPLGRSIPGKELRGYREKGQHIQYGLLPDGGAKLKIIRGHTAIASAFLGPKPHHKSVVCHNNGNGCDNRLSNLRWDKQKGNNIDTLKHGRYKNRHGRQAFSVEDVWALRDDFSGLKISIWKYAKELEINYDTLYRMLKRAIRN